MDILSVLSKFVDAGKLGGWVRSGVGALFVMAIARWPVLGDIVPADVQVELAAAFATVIVGLWSHLAKSIAAGNAPAIASVAKKTAPLLFAMIFLTGLLGACSSSQLNAITTATTQYDNAVNNFNAAAEAINGSIALTSKTVGPYCSAALGAGQNLSKLASGSTNAVTALNATAAALTQYCNALPNDIQGAILALTNAAVAAKQAASGS
jgi:hypothetical protein